MKSFILSRLVILGIIITSPVGFAKAADGSALPGTLSEMSAEEISHLDATTLFARYKDELNSGRLTQDQKEAARKVLMSDMSAYQHESKSNQKLFHTLWLVGAGLLGWFIRRWYRDRFT